MKKIVALSSVVLGVVFLAGCDQQPVSKTQSTTPVPVTQQSTDKKTEWKKYSFIGNAASLEYPKNWCFNSNDCQAIYPVEIDFGNSVFLGSINRGEDGDRIQTISQGFSLEQYLYVKNQNDIEKSLRNNYSGITGTIHWTISKDDSNIKIANIKLANNDQHVYVAYSPGQNGFEGSALSFILPGVIFSSEVDNEFLKSIKLGNVSVFTE